MAQALPPPPTPGRPRPPRAATSERWRDALDRARANGLHARCVAGDPGHWFVTSASVPGSGYLVSLHPTEGPSCLCEAALHDDPVCQHRALVLGKLGLLPKVRPATGQLDDLTARREQRRRALADLYGDDLA